MERTVYEKKVLFWRELQNITPTFLVPCLVKWRYNPIDIYQWIKKPFKVKFCNVRLTDANIAFNWMIYPLPIVASVFRSIHLSMHRIDQLLSNNFVRQFNCKDWIYLPKRLKYGPYKWVIVECSYWKFGTAESCCVNLISRFLNWIFFLFWNFFRIQFKSPCSSILGESAASVVLFNRVIALLTERLK